MSRSRWTIIALMLVVFFLLMNGARNLSLTIDEPSHLVSGYTFLSEGLKGLWTIARRNHPLLIDAWEAFPLHITQPNILLDEIEGWRTNYTEYTQDVLAKFYPLENIEIAGRTPACLLTILLIATVFRSGKDIGGTQGGLLAAIILAFEPNLLAHGRLATNDVGLITLGTLSLLVGWRWWRKSSWVLTLMMGFLVTATLLAKASGVIYAAAFGLSTIALGIHVHRKRIFWYKFVSIIGLSFMVLWACYGFSWGPVSAKIPVSFPAFQHWRALFTQGEKAGERYVFALGIYRSGHWWWYFPLALLIKSSIPFLVLLVSAAAIRLFKREEGKRNHTVSVSYIVFSLLYLGTAVAFGTNIGYRHLLPILPFLTLFLSTNLISLRQTHWRSVLVGVTVGLHILSTLRITPHEITHFNELVGGSEQGYRYLVDSNLDWGQTYKTLKTWLDNHPQRLTKMPYFTLTPPEDYGIAYSSLAPNPGGITFNPYRPGAGRYVISANFLQGIFGTHTDLFAWFRWVEPTAQIGNAVFVYDVPAFNATWIAQCDKPVVPFTTDAIISDLGIESLREITFDCENLWIYPTGGKDVGWHVLAGNHIKPNGLPQQLLYSPPAVYDAFQERHLQASRFAYQQEGPGTKPPFVLYETTELPSLPGEANAFDGPLQFLGTYTSQKDTRLDVETWWIVTAHPITRPFSIMAHLVSKNGETVANADGLGITPPTLQRGDVIVQRHQFTITEQLKRPQVRIGVYWLESMERWRLQDGNDQILREVTLE